MIFIPIQTAITDALEAQPLFSTAPAVAVLTEMKADYESSINTKIKAIGLCVIVLIAHGQDAQNQIHGCLYFEDIDIRVRALEDPAKNNVKAIIGGVERKLHAVDVCEMVARFLRPVTPLDSPLQLQGIYPVDDPAAPSAFECRYKIAAGSSDVATRPAPPGP